MATDYNEIGRKPRINYRSIFTPYSDKTHFVYELVQNADDNKSHCFELQLYESELLVWNDGCRFTEGDVRSICSIGFSNKDLTQIGTFGMGFKAVYAYTDNPEVYSGDEHFRISINNPTTPEGIEIDDIDAKVLEQTGKGNTVFRLPFRENLRQEEEIARLQDRLSNLENQALLFLRNLQKVQWNDENTGQAGSYSCHRSPHDKIQNASNVKLRASLNGKDHSLETYLVFRREVQPPQIVIDELLQLAEDVDESQRIQKSAQKLQPVEIAFKLQNGKIIAMKNCVLFSYFPTEKETHLRFFIQASYKTTLARDNIERNNQWNKWLIQETANFFPEVLEQLKAGKLLEPGFFNVLPLQDDNVPDEFLPIAEAVQKAMQQKPFVPIQDDIYAKAGNVFYPHRDSLRELIEIGWLHPNGSWLHPEIRDTEKFRRSYRVMQEAGVKEIGTSQVLDYLEQQDCNWFKDRNEKWLCSLYIYLKEQSSQLERIKKLPLVRLENGQHVCASEAFFPPNIDEEHEEIAPFLNELPILQSALLEGEEGNDIKAFLEKLGVSGLDPQEMIGKWIFPQYSRTDKPSKEQNLLHVRYIFKVWDKLSNYQQQNLRKEISETPILRTYNRTQPEASDCVKPYDAYLSEAYTGDTDLETYFSGSTRDIWFVDSGYLDGNSNPKKWFKFLKAIGAMDTPRVRKGEICPDQENDQEFDQELDKREIKGQSKRSTWWKQTNIEDSYLDGLSGLLDEISKDKKINLSQALWCLLVKVLPSDRKKRDSLFQGTYHRFYYSHRSDPFDATFYRQLKETLWLPDDQGKLHQPSELFAPTDSNRRVLGDSKAYLHPDFDVGRGNEIGRWLAEKLGVHLNANTNSVLNYLQTMSSTETSVEKIEPLYRFLARQDARPSEEFKEKPLIFTSNPEPSWWRTDEVFWKDESKVFKNDRGYLKVHYSETLKPFFIALGVSEQASQLDYARGIQEITTTEQAKEEEVRSRVRRLYRSLTRWQADQWKIIYDSRCWLGKKGSEWEFFSRDELVWDDHRYIADIFEGEVPFWTFDDLLELTKYLKIEGCSQAKVEFHPEGDQEKDTGLSMTVRNLRPYIHAFLNSHRLCEASTAGKSADVLNPLSVCFVEELKTTYTLKEISLTSPNPRPSFLEVTNEEVTLWLALAADKDDYALLIGDALQDYFGVKDLGRFTEHLLTKKDRDKVLDNWKREGLRTELCVSLPQIDAKEGEEKRSEYIDPELPDEYRDGGTNAVMNGADAEIPITNKTSETGDEDNESLTDKVDESETRPSSGEGNDSRTGEPEIETPVDSEAIEMDKSNDSSTADESESPTNSVSDIRSISSPDTQSSTKTGSGTTQNINGESESEISTIHEDPETGNEDNDSTGNRSETPTYRPRPGGGEVRRRRSKVINTPSGNRGLGYSSSRSGDNGEETHTREEIERIGMACARRHEEEQGCMVEDVSAENCGYDLRSTAPGNEIRCIEVKARADRAPVVLTFNEWSVAEQLENDYFLYVVLDAATQPDLYIIRNPADVVSPIQDIRYQVPLSEITEHGIRV